MYITQPFGEDPEYYKQWLLDGHHGVDLRAAVGTDGLAVEDGEIIASQNGYVDPLSGAYVSGEVVVLRGRLHDWWYLHCDKRLVKVGQRVKLGQKIIETGNTGASKDPHLHLGCRPIKPDMKNGYRGFIDPCEILNNKEDDMITELGLSIVWLALYGRNATPTAAEKAKYIGKRTLDQVYVAERKTQRYKDEIAKAKAGKLNPVDRLPLELRQAYKAPAAQADAAVLAKAAKYERAKQALALLQETLK